MFVGNYNFLGLWLLNFIDSKFDLILIDIKQMLVYTCTFVGM